MKFHEFTKMVGGRTEPVLVDLYNIASVSKEGASELPGILESMEGKARLHFKAAAEDRMKSVLLDQSYEEVKNFLTKLQP